LVKDWSELTPPITDWTQLQSKMQTAVTPPVISTIALTEEFFEIVRRGNLFEILDAMCKKDPELSGVVNAIGFMCAKYYDGIVYVTPEGVFKDPSAINEANTKLVLQEAQRFASADYGFDFRSLMFSVGKALMKHGDIVVHLPSTSGLGITHLQPLPRRIVTAVEKENQILQADQQVWEPNFFVINEGSEKQKVFKAEHCLKVSFDAFAEEVRDLQNRYTFGVWSVPPIYCLQTTVRWKLNTILNDIIWRSRNVPREHHKLNLSQYTPDKYTGTFSQKINAAVEDARKAADAYKDTLAPSKGVLEADQVFVTDKDTEITYIEPKSTTYNAPNELLLQQNRSIYFATGFPGVEEKSYAAAYLSTSFGLMRAEVIAEKAKESLEKLVRIHLKIKLQGKVSDDVLQRIQIATRLILERDRSELARQLALYDSTDAFTDDEIREMAGKGPLTTEQRKQIAERNERRSKVHKESSKQVKRDTMRNPAHFPQRPIHE